MKSLLFLFGGMLFCLQLHAWGPTGHRVIGAIAENHLTKKTKSEIEQLLGHQSLAEVSTWMDEVKSDSRFDHTHSWHYATIPDGSKYATRDNEEGQLVEKIEQLKRTLLCEDSSREAKIEALKFLVHLIGDLHQPLHVGNGTDRGGNDVKVNFFYEKSNLHRVWDSDMIDKKLYSYTELAAICDHATKDQIARWQTGSTADWANECLMYREQIYDIKDPERMGYEYMYLNWGLVQKQLLKGGIRLAYVLNKIYS